MLGANDDPVDTGVTGTLLAFFRSAFMSRRLSKAVFSSKMHQKHAYGDLLRISALKG